MFCIKKKILLLIPICLSSCYGYKAYHKFTDLREDKKEFTTEEYQNCLSLNNVVDLYFVGEPINFEYERVGLVEAVGASGDDEKMLMKELRSSAKARCCDAVIGIRKGNKIENQGNLLIDIAGSFTKDNKPTNTTYNATILTGIAVKRKIKSK